MAKKTNTKIKNKSGEYNYFKIKRKVGMKQNKRGEWIADYKTFYGSSQKEAVAKYEKYMKTGSITDFSCFGELADHYINNVLMLDNSVRESTYTAYINAYKKVFGSSKIIGQEIHSISGADLQEIISADEPAASTRKQALKFLRRLYKYLEAQHIAPDITRALIAPDIESKRKDQIIETFTDDEIKRFLDKTPKNNRLRLLIVLAINTGARIAELLALTYDDIREDSIIINKSLLEVAPMKEIRGSEDKTQLVISDTKTINSIRSIPLSAAVMDEISEHKQRCLEEMFRNGYRTKYVFTTSTGHLYYKSTIRKSFKRLCKTCGVDPRGFHTFRHTFGTKLAAKGIPIQTVSKILGHSDISVTAKYYINVSDQEKKDAVAVLHG